MPLIRHSHIAAYLGNSLAIQTNYDSSKLLIAMLDVKVDFVRDLGPFDCFGSLSEVDEGEGGYEQDAHEETL